MARYGMIHAAALALAAVCAAATGLAQGGRAQMNDEFLKAVTAGDAAAVREMLKRDPSLAGARDERGISALLKALYYGRKDVAEMLLAGRDDLDVFEAAAVGRAEPVQALVAKDARLLNAFSPDGFPALGLAAFFGNLEAVEILLAAGADPNLAARNPMRVTPLHAAAAAGRADIARLLLDHGGNPNARQEGGFAPLHEAANAGNVGLARLLLDRGADVNAATDDGRTPLGFAVAGIHDETAQLLREHGGR